MTSHIVDMIIITITSSSSSRRHEEEMPRNWRWSALSLSSWSQRSHVAVVAVAVLTVIVFVVRSYSASSKAKATASRPQRLFCCRGFDSEQCPDEQPGRPHTQLFQARRAWPGLMHASVRTLCSKPSEFTRVETVQGLGFRFCMVWKTFALLHALHPTCCSART